MKLYSRFFILFVALAAVFFGCDASEDPYLLNPPLPDSTRVRVVNLLPDGQVDVAIPGISVAQGVGPLRVSAFSNVLVPEVTQVIVRRTTPVVRFDTAFNQALSPDSRVTYVVLGNNDTTRILDLGTGGQEETDLRTVGETRIGFINAVDDAQSYYIKTGCQSGPILYNPSPFAARPQTINTKAREMSLYLFSARDSSVPVASARFETEIGTVSYIIATRVDGQIRLYRISSSTAATLLPEIPAETRTTASVEVLNALSNGESVSVRMEGGSNLALGVPGLTVSPARDVDACVNPSGDKLVVETQGGTSFQTPISLSVGSRALVVIHKVGNDSTRALVLSRDLPQPAGGSVYIRGVNVSAKVGRASISIGAGADSINPDYRPFGTLQFGSATGYVRLPARAPAGTYPFMLSSAETGRFFVGGIETLEPGYYTLFVVDDGDNPSLRIVRDDVPNSPLRILRSSGSRVTFFNVMSDASATFTAGPLALPPLPYSYVYSTNIPYNVTTISSNAGQVTVDLVAGGYTIGTTGREGSRQVIAFRSPMDILVGKETSVRFLNAVPNSPELVLRFDSSAGTPTTPLPFGTPIAPFRLQARKYSFFVTHPHDTITRTRADGVELLAGRHYLMVVAPKREGNTSPLDYETFWVQE